MAQLAADERVTLLDKLDQYVFMWGPLPGWLHITLKARSRLETSCLEVISVIICDCAFILKS